jgi:hypothetical protein
MPAGAQRFIAPCPALLHARGFIRREGGQAGRPGSGRERVWGWLRGQALHEVLSSTLLAAAPGWQRGIPARLPAGWITAGGAVVDAWLKSHLE